MAAYELLRGGHDVQVLEARMRPVGSIFTLREPFSSGLHAEAGAVDIGDGYSLMNRYLRGFNLQLTDVQPAPRQIFYAGQQRHVVAAGQEPEWPYQLTPEERRLGQAGLNDCLQSQDERRKRRNRFSSRSPICALPATSARRP